MVVAVVVFLIADLACQSGAVDDELDETVDDEIAVDGPADDGPADDEPADDKPADDKPADDKPADDEPADDEPPGDETEAEEPAESEGTTGQDVGSNPPTGTATERANDCPNRDVCKASTDAREMAWEAYDDCNSVCLTLNVTFAASPEPAPDQRNPTNTAAPRKSYRAVWW